MVMKLRDHPGHGDLDGGIVLKDYLDELRGMLKPISELAILLLEDYQGQKPSAIEVRTHTDSFKLDPEPEADPPGAAEDDPNAKQPGPGVDHTDVNSTDGAHS